MSYVPSIWFITGSQHLYGPDAIRQVGLNSAQIVAAINATSEIPTEIQFKGVMTDSDLIRSTCAEANNDPSCAGVVLWMHTFSPAKMWIGGLTHLNKPVCHLHTQFNSELPWESIDMDFMNLNQAAHGDREAGHLHTRIGLRRKVIVGHWSNKSTQGELGSWCKVALAWHDWQGAKFARFGDNMRYVSVTDGDKVSAETQFGFSVNGFGVGDLAKYIDEVTDSSAAQTVQEYNDLYDVAPALRPGAPRHKELIYGAKQEIGIRNFLTGGGFKGFTTTFEDLHGLHQLPGLACQRLMAEGYGFGAEGDWKTSALLRAFKVMEPKGTSFMEDYTYDLTEGKELVLGAHMLEICPSIAKTKPKLEIHPLAIGGKSDPVRLVFDARTGPATNTSLIDLGHRFRLIVNEVDAVDVPSMPNLPVARAVWKVQPDFRQGVASWIYAGGAHHTVYSYNITAEQVRDFATIAGVECVSIGRDSSLRQIQTELLWNESRYASRGV